MSTFVLPPNLPDGVPLLLFAAFTVCDDTGRVEPEGEPPSSIATLMRLTRHDDSTIRRNLRALEQHGLASRTAPAPGRGVVVRIHLERLKVRDGCQVCGSPARGTGRWCARCKQVLGRDDRAWQIRALELHGEGMSPPRIAAVLNRPLFVASADDGRDPNGGAVVPYLLGQGLLAASWAERLREAQRGPVEEA